MIVEVNPRLSLDERARVHGALADVHRLAIVDELRLSDRMPSELGEALGLDSNLLAHHLRVLEAAGLIERVASHADKRRRYCRLRKGMVEAFGAAQHQLRARNVVFVCSHNSARSQLAAALWNQTAHPVRATSAGTHPASSVHAHTVRAGRDAGLDLSKARPRSVAELEVEPDLVITVCDQAHEELLGCGWRELHWSLPDPAVDGRAGAFSRTVHELRDRIGPAHESITESGSHAEGGGR